MGLDIKIGVILFANVFINIRNDLLAKRQLVMVYFVSSPHLACIALLRYIDRPIHLIAFSIINKMDKSSTSN